MGLRMNFTRYFFCMLLVHIDLTTVAWNLFVFIYITMIMKLSVLNLKVRKSACSSLGLLTALSEKFAGEALNYLVDMLNDDSVTVRLQALKTMLLMANCEHLNVQEIHMHMVGFLSQLLLLRKHTQALFCLSIRSVL